MRAALLAALLLLLPIAPAAQAQDAKPLLTDAAGDVVVNLGMDGSEQRQPYSGPASEGTDLVGLALGETDETLLFTLQTASLEVNGYNRYEVRFTWNGLDHVLAFSAYSDYADPAGQVYRYACLMTEDDDGDTNYVWCNEEDIRADESAKSFTAEVPKYVILDEKNRMPLRGDAITDIHVSAVGSNIISGGMNAHLLDLMPDDEGAGLAYTLARGDSSAGHLRITSEDRIRVSNGGATTFVFQVLVINQGESDDEVTLAVSDLPDGWTATVQSPVAIPAKKERTVPVLASVPFAHDHGGFSSFNVSAQSRSDPNAVASMRLGVLHTPIPQPAGHHPDLFLHAESYNGGVFGTVFPYTYAYMNTEATNENDAAEIPSYGGGMSSNYWFIYMNPGIEMGLDFDIERTGSITGKLMGRNVGEGTLNAELWLWDSREEDSIRLAESDEATLALDPSNPTDFTLTLTPDEDADYVPYAPDRTLYLMLWLENDLVSPRLLGNDPTSPSLLTEGWKMNLPLNEYHDKLTGITEAAGSVLLLADGPVEKAGRPGTTLTYTFHMQADTDGTYEIDVAGADAAHAALTPDGAVSLAKGEKRPVTLAVRIPAEAADGDELEVLLFVHDQTDPSKTAIARTKTKVVISGEAAPDEEQVFLNAQDADKATPGAGLALLVGAAVVAGALRRRAR